MAKLKDTEILTKQVYLNIKKGEDVETKTMPTVSALNLYGEKEVVFIYPPSYSPEANNPEPKIIKKARKDGVITKDTRKPGTTVIILAG